MKNKIIFTLISIILIAAFLVAGCAKSTTTAPSTTAAPSPTQATSSTAATPTKITIAISDNIGAADCTNFASSAKIDLDVFEPLLTYDINAKLVPLLATSWTVSPDGKMIEMKLKQGVKFHTGEIFTAQDVVFTFNRYQKIHMQAQDGLKNGYDRTEAVDDYTVRFYFTKYDPLFLSTTISLANFLMCSKSYYDKVGEDQFVAKPSGTGPYKITDWKAGQYVNLVANEEYWGNKPSIKQASFLSSPNGSTRIAMLQSGEADMIDDTPWNSVSSLEKAGFARIDIPLLHDVFLQFQLFNPDAPWYNVKVRQAINYAIDKKALIEKLYGGVPTEGVWQMPWEPGYDPSLKPSYPYDLAKAKQLMKDAGYADGFTMPVNYCSSFSWAKDTADYIAQTLTQLNITCKLTGIAFGPEWFQSVGALHGDTKAQMVLLWDAPYPGNPSPLVTLLNGFSGTQRISMFGDTALDKIIDQAVATMDENERAALVKQAMQIIDKVLPAIPIALEINSFMMKPNIVYTPTKKGTGFEYPPANLKDLKFK
jgi:peptide/nickel transport system substrate-binding protein